MSGVTNSRPSRTRPTLALASDHGYDTIRVRFRTADHDAYSSFKQSASGYLEGRFGEAYRRSPLGGRVGVYPDGVVYVESRAGALVAGSPEDHSLCSPDRLPEAVRVAREVASSECGVSVDAPAALGRADLAGELRYARGRDGLAFLVALSELQVPWGKVGVEGKRRGAVETVYVRPWNGRSVHLRAYDKGVEAGTSAPGERVRVERQVRAKKHQEQTVEAFLTGDHRARFLGHLRTWAEVADVKLTDPAGALAALRDACDDGRLTARMRDTLTGYLVHGRRRDDYPRDAPYRYDALLRDLGIQVDEQREEAYEVPVGRHLALVADLWSDAA